MKFCNGHSFRIGAATAVAHAGIPNSTIKPLGRWRSSAFTRYLQPPVCSIAEKSRCLLQLQTRGIPTVNICINLLEPYITTLGVCIMYTWACDIELGFSFYLITSDTHGLGSVDALHRWVDGHSLDHVKNE